MRFTRGTYSNLSKKDLRNVAYHLKVNARKGVDLEALLKSLLDKKAPIPWKYHLGGVSHKAGLGPSRCPIKCYRHALQTLRSRTSANKGLPIRGFTIESTTSKLRGGYRRSARGGVHITDARRYRLVLRHE